MRAAIVVSGPLPVSVIASCDTAFLRFSALFCAEAATQPARSMATETVPLRHSMGNSEIVTTGRRPQPRSEKLPIRACSSAAPTAISHGDRPSSRVVEFIGALLVLAETGILFAGVVS